MKDTINIGDTKEMLCEMLAIPSVSGDEGALSDYIAQKLRDAGAECVRQQIVDGDRRNVFAEVTGSLPGKTILLTGHMDTVEAGDGWTVNPFAGTERDGRIYGRGANDMKAGIAIILQTVSTCVRNRGRLRGKIVVAFVCDEEAYSEGVLCAIKEGNIHADFGIAAEPEYHHAVIGSCGKVLIRAVAHGKAAHAAEAESGINAINEMSKFLSVLERVPLQTSEVMPAQPYITLRVRGGSNRYSMVVPDSCEALISKHTVPGETPEKIIVDLQSAVQREKLHASFEFAVEKPFYPSFLLNDNLEEICRLRHIFEEVTGEELKLVCSDGVSDNNHWSTIGGIPSVCFGPDGKGLHQSDEWVSTEQMENVLEVYLRFFLEDEE